MKLKLRHKIIAFEAIVNDMTKEISNALESSDYDEALRLANEQSRFIQNKIKELKPS